jgi:hypothetical protein
MHNYDQAAADSQRESSEIIILDCFLFGTSYLSFAGIVDIGDLIPNRRRSQRARVKLCTLFARWTIDLWPPA